MSDTTRTIKKKLSRNVGYDWKRRGESEEREVQRAEQEMEFVSLHHHSTFSYQDGYGLPEDHVLRAAELGMRALALTEHGNVSSHVKLEQAAHDAGIKPLFGCELYTSPSGNEMPTESNPLGLSRRKNHLTVLAMDRRGYHNLLQLVSRSWSEGFYQFPTVTGEMLKEHNKGLIVLSGCTASLLSCALIGGKWLPKRVASYELAKKYAEKMKGLFGDRFYLETQIIPELEDVCTINQAWERLSEELDIPLVATGDVHVTEEGQEQIRKILHAIGRGKDLERVGQEFDYSIGSHPPESDMQVVKRLCASGLSERAAMQALESTGIIADRCTLELPRAEPLHFPIEGERRAVILEQLRQGWMARGLQKRSKREQKRYRDRLMYELDIIVEKEFVDYFLVVSDMVKFAKRSNIPVGPARGSAAASLVCWLLEITEVDPLRRDIPELIFERFIDLNREDLPDIDLDFDDELREQVKEYMSGRYGEEHVSNIGTFTSFKGKNSLDEVGRVFKIPQWEVDTLKDLLIERSSGDLRASATIEDTVEMFEQAREVVEQYPELMIATDLEGNYKTFGTHAGGIVVSTAPLNTICAVYEREGKPPAVSLDKWDAEYLGLLKIDVLSLSTMGLIRRAIEQVGMSLQELYALPLDDEETIQGFRDGDVVGVFQFDGRATRSVNEAVRPDNFAELADINALSRPGPLHSGATADYIDVKHGRKKRTSHHPLVDEITAGTYGCIIYQEQILRIVREVGNFDWTHAAYIRKIISKKLGEQEFNRQWDAFRDGALENGLDEDTARTIWNQLITSGAYAFNAAHCVSYSLIAYWTMWLKRHHPTAFFTAALEKYGKKKNSYGILKRDELLKDTKKHGRNLKVMPPDLHESRVGWTGTDHAVRAGFSQIYGIGKRMGQRIVEHVQRDPWSFLDWDDLEKIKGIGPKTIERIKEFVTSEDPFDLELLNRMIREVEAEIRSGRLTGFDGEPLPAPTHRSIQIPYQRGEDVAVVWLGIIRHRNLKDLFELHYSKTGEELDPEEVKNPELNEWVVMLGEDEEDILTVTVDRWRYPKLRHQVWSLKTNEHLVLVRGWKKGWQSRRAIYVREMWAIEP